MIESVGSAEMVYSYKLSRNNAFWVLFGFYV